jgi:hypothetical protein
MLFRRSNIWWYDLSFRNQRIRESTHSHAKTVAREAELQRQRDLERVIHNITEVQQYGKRVLLFQYKGKRNLTFEDTSIPATLECS